MFKSQKEKFLALVVLFAITIPNSAFAQAVDPPPPAPINDHVNLTITLMLVFLLCFFSFKSLSKNNLNK